MKVYQFVLFTMLAVTMVFVSCSCGDDDDDANDDSDDEGFDEQCEDLREVVYDYCDGFPGIEAEDFIETCLESEWDETWDCYHTCDDLFVGTSCDEFDQCITDCQATDDDDSDDVVDDDSDDDVDDDADDDVTECTEESITSKFMFKVEIPDQFRRIPHTLTLNADCSVSIEDQSDDALQQEPDEDWVAMDETEIGFEARFEQNDLNIPLLLRVEPEEQEKIQLFDLRPETPVMIKFWHPYGGEFGHINRLAIYDPYLPLPL